MSNYSKITDFAAKDALSTGNPAKIVKGTEIDDELVAISGAIASKANTAGPTFTGTTTVDELVVGGSLDVTGSGTIDGDLTIGGATSLQAVTATSVVADTLTLDSAIVFEGATEDAYETTITFTDPTADRTLTFPDKTGTVALTSDLASTSITTASGTYSASGSSTITVSISSHGRSVGDPVYLNFTSGTAAEGDFTVASVVDVNTYTVTYSGSITTSGNVTQYYSVLGQIRLASPAEVLVGANVNKAMTPYTYQTTKFGSVTAVATTSGTSVEFTDIPTWAKKITVVLSGVSLAATDDICIQLSRSSGYVTSGYKCGYGTMAGTGSSRDSSFVLADGITSSQFAGGAATLFNVGSDDWAGTAMITRYSSNGWVSACSISLGGTLTAIKVFTVSGTAFDAGLINILYE